jgi:hypothetical protein
VDAAGAGVNVGGLTAATQAVLGALGVARNDANTCCAQGDASVTAWPIPAKSAAVELGSGGPRAARGAGVAGGASLFFSMSAATAAQLAEGVATAVGEREQLRACVSIDARLLEQLDSQRGIPRLASTRLVDVELPAQQLKSCWASAHLEQQLMEAQERATASLRGAWMVGVCSHAAGRYPRTA